MLSRVFRIFGLDELVDLKVAELGRVSHPHVVFVYMMIEQSCVLDVVHRTTFHRHVAHQAGPLCALKRNPHNGHSIWCFW